MPNFDVSDKFNASKNFTQVKFGENAPLLEVELNEMQKIQMEARADIVRNIAHSGFIKMGNYYPYSNKVNTIQLEECVVNVNGYILTIPKQDIKLPDSPTEGYRDDFVFLEVWFEEIDAVSDSSIIDSRIKSETSRRVKLNHRIRTVAGVDFTKNPKGLGYAGVITGSGDADKYQVTPQGGLTEPIAKATWSTVFYSNVNIKARTEITHTKGLSGEDVGLYVGGYIASKGSANNHYNTANGLVYAIPMFKVSRRNTGSFSVSNPNGAESIKEVMFSPVNPSDPKSIDNGMQAQVVMEDTSVLSVGEVLRRSDNLHLKLRVVSIDSPTLITVEYFGSGVNMGLFALPFISFFEKYSRPDKKLANVIHVDDTVDLRSLVTLNGYNYNQLMEENFDKLIRGELQTRERLKSVKVYTSLRKTPIDSNTIFYASFDGVKVPELGSQQAIGGTFLHMPTGYGLRTDNGVSHKINEYVPSGTIDFLIDLDSQTAETQDNCVLSVYLENEDGYRLGVWRNLKDPLRFFPSNTAYITGKHTEGIHHYRITWNDAEMRLNVYEDGVHVGYKTYTNPLFLEGSNLLIGGFRESYRSKQCISDFSISKIDRGDVFQTLPKDLKEGFAVLGRSFTGQRTVLSDAQMSKTVRGIARTSNKSSSTGIKVVKGNTNTDITTWQIGDKIIIEGIANEIIPSNPVLKFSNGDSALNVEGTLSGVGSSTCTFTIGNTPNLDTDDVYIEYRLSSPKSSGALPVLLNEVQGGEYSGERYLKDARVILKANLVDKISGNVVTNPHETKYSITLTDKGNPSSFSVPLNTSAYSKISNNDGIFETVQAVDGKIAQKLFSFNVLAEIERQFGVLPFATIAEKITWLKSNISYISLEWKGKVNSPSGNKAILNAFNHSANTWATTTSWESEGEGDLSITSGATPSTTWWNGLIGADGKAHWSVNTLPSIGSNPSALSTDYVELTIWFGSSTGYEALTPENPFYTGKKRNIIFVRKETKEITTEFPVVQGDNLAVYGNYLPKQYLNAPNATPSSAYNLLFSNRLLISTSSSATYMTLPSNSTPIFYSLLIHQMALPGSMKAGVSTLNNDFVIAGLSNYSFVPTLINPTNSTSYILGNRGSNLTPLYGENLPSALNKIVLAYGLVVIDDEIILRVLLRHSTDNLVQANYGINYFTVSDFYLKNRPLVKGVY